MRRPRAVGCEPAMMASPSGVPVTRYSAGILGRVSCEFDMFNGGLLSRTTPLLSGSIDGHVFVLDPEVAVACPRFNKCEACPNRPENQEQEQA